MRPAILGSLAMLKTNLLSNRNATTDTRNIQVHAVLKDGLPVFFFGDALLVCLREGRAVVKLGR